MRRNWTPEVSAVFALALALQALLAPIQLPAQSPATPVYRDATRPANERAHDLVQRMTLDEKAAQLEDWATAIPRLGVPDYQTWSEALHGVARAGHATVFPQAIGMAATWDTEMVKQMGDVISTEARGKYNEAQREGNHRIFWGLTFWSPNINIFRDPRWGRGQETYGEDPFLTGKMGIAFIDGVQGPDAAHPKAVATSKHFAVHSGPESLRHGFDVKVSPRDLEETYLAAFRATVTDGHVKSVMCAYNAVDGMGACANKMLLEEHLKQAWGFKGFVVSDCGAIMDVTQGHKNAPDIVHAAAISLAAGTDLSCSIWEPGFNTLADAVRKGLVTEDMVTRAAERLYAARFELGMFDEPGSNPNDKIDMSQVASEEHRAEALKAAEESIVLLKNDGLLPLKNAKTIAVIGPTAELLASLEGNYNGQPVRPVTPLDGIVKQFGAENVRYAQGSSLAAGAPVPVPRTAFEGGLKAEYFATSDWTGRPVATSTEPRIDYDWVYATPVPEIHTHDYSVRWTGTIRVPAPGKYRFATETQSGFPYSPRESYRAMVDGKLVSQGKTEGETKPAEGASPTSPPHMANMAKGQFEVTFSDTNPHAFEFGYSHAGDESGGGITLSWEAPPEAQIAEAVNAAKAADVVAVFVGLSPNLEGEEMPIKIEGFSGGDRTSIDLPATQEKLLEALGAAGKPVVVVNLSGSAVALNWANQHAGAILQAWYPGVEGGTAIAKTLAGESNPAGRLPVTFYASVQDLPAFTEYAMKNRTYRYYAGKPLWGFGFGLSYSTFKYGEVKLASTSVDAGKSLTATVTVTNTSQVAGDEVVEAYLKTPQKGGPSHSLVGFQRVPLNPGESREVAIEVSPRSLSAVDDSGKRSILAGEYRLSIGSTQPQETQAKSEANFTVKGSAELPK
ncbi:Beta-glucosidase [Candidatus Koribacter versatilis Ellin345]|uniref:Beta-glucosidase n=1 Tax=Koribacter versatilis (strain Ellin345) TaxID=204669 RepID=Q1IP21_KORVE|nr:glycoside hydrolase family 3 C-terminal domain-containing protein [Candidatus Koribacter versatilis]ABF41379.1 Beta-glucosidase [Candidatus Koribacter versatilis Ellin345]